MDNETESGAILTSNFKQGKKPSLLAGKNSNVRLLVGQIVNVLYTDSPDNYSKQHVEYDILINDHDIADVRYTNCRALDTFGDDNNFEEKVLQPITDGKRGDKSDNEDYQYKNGAMVLVGFIDGHKHSPVILGGLQHPSINPRLNEASAVASKSSSIDDRLKELPQLQPGAESSPDNDGQRILGEYNGLRWNINKHGELTIVFQGAKDEKGNLKDASAQPTIVKINKDGEIFIIDNLDQEIKISRVDQKITINDGQDEPNIITIDRANNKINVKSPSKIELNAPVIHGAHDEVITSGKDVKLGGKGANQQAVLGNIFLALFNDTVAKLNAAIGVINAQHAAGLSTASTMSANKHLSANVKVDTKFSGKPDVD